MVGALVSPVNASTTKPPNANASAHWRYVVDSVLKYAKSSERTSNPMTSGMQAQGLTRAAEKLVKSPAAKKRAATKAKQLCQALRSPGQAGIAAAASTIRSSREAFLAGVGPSAPLARQHSWDLNGVLDISARSYAYAYCPSQQKRVMEAHDRSLETPAGTPGTYAKIPTDSIALVSVRSCGAGWFPAVSIPLGIPEEAAEYGTKSVLLMAQCASDVRMDRGWNYTTGTLRYKGLTYPVYIEFRSSGDGMALVYAPVLIKQVANFTEGVSTKPATNSVAYIAYPDQASGTVSVKQASWADTPFLITYSYDKYFGAPVFGERGYLNGIVTMQQEESASSPGGDVRISTLPLDQYCGAWAKCFFIWKQ
jgi:hypothetical protein